MSKNPIFHDHKIHFLQNFQKYSKIRNYGTTSLAHKNMNFRAI